MNKNKIDFFSHQYQLITCNRYECIIGDAEIKINYLKNVGTINYKWN